MMLAAAQFGLTNLTHPCELAGADFAATGRRPPVQEAKTMNSAEWSLLVLLSVLWGGAFFLGLIYLG